MTIMGLRIQPLLFLAFLLGIPASSLSAQVSYTAMPLD